MNEPKVLHIHFGKEGGAERFFVNLANAFGERGVKQKFIIRPNRSWTSEISDLGPIIKNNYSRLSLTSPILELRTRRLINKWKPDAVMAWMPRAARLIPDIDGPVKLTRLGDFPQHLRHFKNCDVLVGNLPGICDRCTDLGWEKPLRVISNFPREIKPVPVSRAELDTPEDAFVISGAGRFVHRKGMDLLVRAAAQVPGSYLWLIGEGKEQPLIEGLIDEYGIRERTRFIGWVDEPIHYIASSDVLGMPSRHEPLGNVILEAWQAGTPVVSTLSEGPRWYMNEDNGYLVEIDDLDNFVKGLLKVQADKTYAKSLVAGGHAQLKKMFTKAGVVDQYLNLFLGKDPL